MLFRSRFSTIHIRISESIIYDPGINKCNKSKNGCKDNNEAEKADTKFDNLEELEDFANVTLEKVDPIIPVFEDALKSIDPKSLEKNTLIRTHKKMPPRPKTNIRIPANYKITADSTLHKRIPSQSGLKTSPINHQRSSSRVKVKPQTNESSISSSKNVAKETKRNLSRNGKKASLTRNDSNKENGFGQRIEISRRANDEYPLRSCRNRVNIAANTIATGCKSQRKNYTSRQPLCRSESKYLPKICVMNSSKHENSPFFDMAPELLQEGTMINGNNFMDELKRPRRKRGDRMKGKKLDVETKIKRRPKGHSPSCLSVIDTKSNYNESLKL